MDREEVIEKKEWGGTQTLARGQVSFVGNVWMKRQKSREKVKKEKEDMDNTSKQHCLTSSQTANEKQNKAPSKQVNRQPVSPEWRVLTVLYPEAVETCRWKRKT